MDRNRRKPRIDGDCLDGAELRRLAASLLGEEMTSLLDLEEGSTSSMSAAAALLPRFGRFICLEDIWAAIMTENDLSQPSNLTKPIIKVNVLLLSL